MIASLRLHGERGMPGIEWAIIGAITGSGIPIGGQLFVLSLVQR
jgi:hypothetical protein